MTEYSIEASVNNVLYGIADISLNAIRANVAMTTNPVMITEYSFVYRTPEFQVLQTFFLDVFTPEFWFASLVIILMIVVVGWIFSRSIRSSEEKLSMILLSVFVLTSAVDLQ